MKTNNGTNLVTVCSLREFTKGIVESSAKERSCHLCWVYIFDGFPFTFCSGFFVSFVLWAVEELSLLKLYVYTKFIVDIRFTVTYFFYASIIVDIFLMFRFPL